MNNPKDEEFGDWVFPKLDMDDDFNNMNLEVMDGFLENGKDGLDEYQQGKDVKQGPSEAEIAAEMLKVEYEKKILLLESIIKQMEKPLLDMDEESILLVQSIVKKSIKNLIHVKLNEDPKVIADLIHELIALAHDKNDAVTISLSEVDYNRLNNSGNFEFSKFMIMDTALSACDVIVKANFSEIRAVLDERIDKILGLTHD